MSVTPHRSLVWSLPLAALIACTDGANDDSDPVPTTDTAAEDAIVPRPDLYRFPSRDDPSVDSVAYSGQVFRQLLIEDMKAHLSGLTDRLNGGFIPETGDVTQELEFYFEFDSSTSGSLEFEFAAGTPLQSTYDDVSTDKNLVGKLAGNDPIGQHADWSTEFVGWDAPGVTTPESLVRAWFTQIDEASTDWAVGTYPLDPSGDPVPTVYITAEGHDLQQLLQKFLGGAVSLSQGADDYLDDDEPGKGLLSDHTAAEEGEPYTALEHAWDEGFGFFGAARGYPSMPDATIADPGYADLDGDGVINLQAEVCWGHSANAAKRDVGSAPVATTDFTAEAWEGFYEGRLLIAGADGALSDSELTTLRGHRDQALIAWEAAIGATLVHYINEVLVDMSHFDTVDYAFADHAKHWSELKGFALGLQFNPDSPVSDADFATLHTLLGQAPVLPTADAPTREAYANDLRAARTLLATAYGFDAANLGDDNGENGW